jgi:superfamily II DNA or RNA helicase
MKLTDRCQHSFGSRVRSRGDSYARSGYITELTSDGIVIDAEVTGSYENIYDVEIDFADCESGKVLASCTCPYFEGGDLCKHIWAVLRQMDESGVKFNGRIPTTLSVEPNYHDDEDYEDNDSSDTDWMAGAFGQEQSPSPVGRRMPPRQPAWRIQLERLGLANTGSMEQIWEQVSGKHREPWFVLNLSASHHSGHVSIDLFCRQTKKNGELGKAKSMSPTEGSISQLTRAEDRQLVSRLSQEMDTGWYGHGGACALRGERIREIAPELCRSGRFLRRASHRDPFDEEQSIIWDDGPTYQFRLEVVSDDRAPEWTMRGRFHRGEERIDLTEPLLVLPGSVMLFEDRMALLDATDDEKWIAAFRGQAELKVAYADRWDFLRAFYSLEQVPDIDLPDNLVMAEESVQPRPILRVHKPSDRYRTTNQCFADLLADYDGTVVPITDAGSAIVDAESQRIIRRDRPAEVAALKRLEQWNVRPEGHRYYGPDAHISFLAKRLDEIVITLTTEEWTVEAEGHRVRQPGSFQASVTSGVDWFELDASFDYGDEVTAKLPDLIKAIEKGSRYVTLSDGSRGLLPEEWLAKFGPLAELARTEGESLRFANSQAALLDALLAAQENVTTDRDFAQFRKRLRSFDGIKPKQEPRGFSGELRAYQREGLGWLDFLETFGVGGCLADDMGLGKTVQILALLQSRRVGRKNRGPSMIVVPRSLVFNWIDEASRFAPRIPFRNYTGLDRGKHLESLAAGDVLVTTYGTLRRDIVKLKEIDFDYVILDEAQAIKNQNSQVSKAARLIHARHRLAATGTPIENHIGELWSLFEFLNPGMLGRSSVFQRCWKNGQSDDPEKLDILRSAMAPFLLRRTKEQVLSELPAKTEQTLHCELDRKERKAYNQLRDYYRDLLKKKIDDQGLKRSKIHVLEALLRLRQAACHRGLIDEDLADQSSAKLETLIEQLGEILDEGHKVLVFSQFTKLLAIVKKHLDDRGVVYEYLDGRTRNRKQRVARFQEDPACPVFLISLKAGGHGLNLTAADYVFILDPWWNPAVEAQAIDRAHRIGQTRPVFAYRLIARDTVEEKIVDLQASKRNLAEAIVSGDGSLMQQLTAEDLQRLFS